MATLPTPGGDINVWGDELNTWLLVDHNADGTNKDSPTLIFKVAGDTVALTTGDGQEILTVPPSLNGKNLVDADIGITTVSSSGLVTVNIRNITDSVDMLSTRMTIDVGEYDSFTALTQPQIDTAHDDVATGDRISVADVDIAGTGTKGLSTILKFA